LIFLFIFAPRLDLKLVIHGGFFSFAVLAMLIAIRQRNIFTLPRPLVVVGSFFIMLGVYYLVLALIYDNNAFDFIKILISVILSVIFGWLLASFLVNHGADNINLLDSLIEMCVIGAILNSSIILVEFVFPEIKTVIESYMLQIVDSNINYAEHIFRLRGMASAGGAGLSVFNAIAILFLMYLVINKKFSAFFAILGAVVITCSNIFTGRTGLILSLLFTFSLLIIVLVQNVKTGLYGVVRAVGVALFFSFLLSFLFNYNLDPEAAGWAFEWADNLEQGKLESASSDDLKTMLFLPDDPIHLLFGIGFFEGIGKIYPRSDSGYVKSVLSIGLLLSILLYAAVIFMFSRVSKVSSKYFWLVVSVSGVMLLIEVKEPFLYQNFTARMIFLLSGAAMFLLAKRRALKGS
jgi:hypothetical protein